MNFKVEESDLPAGPRLPTSTNRFAAFANPTMRSSRWRESGTALVGPPKGALSEKLPTRRGEKRKATIKRETVSIKCDDDDVKLEPLGIKEEDRTDKKPKLEKHSRPPSRTTLKTKEASPSKSSRFPRPKSEPGRLYPELSGLPDYLEYGLDVVFCGMNPGRRSATLGHFFAHPTNHFWSCLHESGFTPRRLPPDDDHILPSQFCLGLTDLVNRPSKTQVELLPSEQQAGVKVLLDKVAQYLPRVVCLANLTLAEYVRKAIAGALKKLKVPHTLVGPAAVGVQQYSILFSAPGTSGVQEVIFCATPSTSGLVTQYQRSDKVAAFIKCRETLAEVKAGTFSGGDTMMRIKYADICDALV